MTNKTIRHGDGITLISFPDGQPHVRLHGVHEGESVRLVWPVRNPIELVQLMEIADALDGVFARKSELVIPYLMGARSDRRMLPGDSVDLKVVANAINLCRFRRVSIFDVHSDVALQLIHHSESIDNRMLLERYEGKDAVLIVPDAGSMKRADAYLERCPGIKDVVTCTKVRDLNNGFLRLRVLEREKCMNRSCIVIDDLCDGGATFLAIAEQAMADDMTLIVSHGIFSKGFDALTERFDRIITSDSFSTHAGAPDCVTVVPLNF